MVEFINASKMARKTAATGPDLSTATLRRDFLFFLPGVTPSLVTFVVFGTTKTFRDHMAATFVPNCVRRWWRRAASMRNPGSRRRASRLPGPSQPSEPMDKDPVSSLPPPTPVSLTPGSPILRGGTPVEHEAGIMLRDLDTAGGKREPQE